MKKLVKMIFLTMAICCIGVGIYFIITVIGSSETVQDAYDNMNGKSTNNTGSRKYIFLKSYLSSTGDDSILFSLGMNKDDAEAGGLFDYDPGTGDAGVKEEPIICNCTSRCDSSGNDDCPVCSKNPASCAFIPDCTCTGTTRCSKGHEQDCEACKINIKYCKIAAVTVTGGIPFVPKTVGWYHTNQKETNGKKPVRSLHSGSTGWCFFVAIQAIASGKTGRNVDMNEVFAADGGSFKDEGECYRYSKDYTGSIGRGNKILSNLGLSESLHDVGRSGFSTTGTYLIHVAGDTSKQWSSGKEHWFVIHNGILMCSADSKKPGITTVTSLPSTANHCYRVE